MVAITICVLLTAIFILVISETIDWMVGKTEVQSPKNPLNQLTQTFPFFIYKSMLCVKNHISEIH